MTTQRTNVERYIKHGSRLVCCPTASSEILFVYCPLIAAPEELMECDFESQSCGWTQDPTDERDWERHLGPTQTGKTGPKFDHSFMNESGKYIQNVHVYLKGPIVQYEPKPIEIVVTF